MYSSSCDLELWWFSRALVLVWDSSGLWTHHVRGASGVKGRCCITVVGGGAQLQHAFYWTAIAPLWRPRCMHWRCTLWLPTGFRHAFATHARMIDLQSSSDSNRMIDEVYSATFYFWHNIFKYFFKVIIPLLQIKFVIHKKNNVCVIYMSRLIIIHIYEHRYKNLDLKQLLFYNGGSSLHVYNLQNKLNSDINYTHNFNVVTMLRVEK